MIETLSIALPIIAIFGFLGWLEIFFTVYIRYEKMKNPKRFFIAGSIATITILALCILVLLFLYLYFGGSLNG